MTIKLFCDLCGNSIGEPIDEEHTDPVAFYGFTRVFITSKRGIVIDSSENCTMESSLLCAVCNGLLVSAISKIKDENANDS